MLILSQLGGQPGTTVPQLADPPIFTYYILENPWPLAIGLAVAGLIGMIVLKHRGMAIQSNRALLAGLLLAAVVAGLGTAITTERETLRQRTRDLVDLTAAVDTTRLRDLLTDQVRVGVFSPHLAAIRGRDEVLAAVRQYLGDRFPLESHRIGPVQAVLDGPDVARTQVRVWMQPHKDQQLYGIATGGWFRIDWVREPGGPWRASVIAVMQIDGVGVNAEIGR